MKNYYLLLCTILLITFGCKDKGDLPDPESNAKKIYEFESMDSEINDFVWRAMNTWYKWQAEVPSLSGSVNDDFDNYNAFLEVYDTHELFFRTLLFEPGKTDRFSWFVEDYEAQNNAFRGINTSFGFDFNLVRLCSECTEVIAYVTIVHPNSPASGIGMKRGDFFYKVNDKEITTSNFNTTINPIFADNSVSITFNSVQNGGIVASNTESMEVAQVIENPIFHHSIIEQQNTKIGYLVYNSFNYAYHSELNAVFAEFKNAGIQELILDMRYNGGGALITSSYLASMIYGEAKDRQDVFARLEYNEQQKENSDLQYPFFDGAYVYDKNGNREPNQITLNRLSGLNRLYVIGTGDTASASEMIMNGLSPYMNVIHVGTTTKGKNVGSRTLYDSSDFSQSNNINKKHKYALQPITFQIFNSLSQSDYTQGFEPDIEVIEYASEIKDFGDLEEPLLKTALSHIAGITTGRKTNASAKNKFVFSSLDKKKFHKEMYILDNE